MRGLPVLRDAWDRVTLYLPIILTALLALGTYWLVRSAPRVPAPTNAEAPRHEPDFFMRGFVVKNFLPSGDLRSELYGNEGRHYPDNDTIEVDQLRWRSVSPDGRVTRGSAQRGLANGDATEIQLFGDAVVVREATPLAPRLEFRGEFLHIYTDVERVKSHKPVTLIRGGDQFTADTLDYDSLSGVADLDGRVRGVLRPRNAGRAR